MTGAAASVLFVNKSGTVFCAHCCGRCMSATSTNEMEGLCREVNPVGIRVEIVQLNFLKLWERDHMGDEIL